MADVDEASHRRVTNVWRPPGMGACYRAACSCGWVSSAPEVGYGYPLSHDEDFIAHYAKATSRCGDVYDPDGRPDDPPCRLPAGHDGWHSDGVGGMWEA